MKTFDTRLYRLDQRRQFLSRVTLGDGSAIMQVNGGRNRRVTCRAASLVVLSLTLRAGSAPPARAKRQQRRISARDRGTLCRRRNRRLPSSGLAEGSLREVHVAVDAARHH